MRTLAKMLATEKHFNEIVGRFSEPLYWHIRRLVVSHEDAQDILQETFIRAYRKLWLLRDENALRPWLYKIATNETKRHLTSKYKGEKLSDELLANMVTEPYIDLSRKSDAKLQEAILQLSEVQRLVFTMKYYDEMDYKEISAITGSSVSSLKVSYHYAKEKVQNYLKENVL